jgi:glyceraldehyde-3-phosphate dehydrogenase/erythrose-4-phosphate dehydrogenase
MFEQYHTNNNRGVKLSMFSDSEFKGVINLVILFRKIKGIAFRVPVNDVSIVDVTLCLKKGGTKKEIEEVIENASKSTEMKNVIGISDERLVSSDYIHDSRSCILDTRASIYLDEKFVKLVAWCKFFLIF